jgi:hypothetical protein
MNITGSTKGEKAATKKAEKTFIELKEDIAAADNKPKSPKTKNIAKLRELGEQPVHPIKKAPKKA